MLNNAQYTELLSIARRRFPENGEDILHDYIAEIGFNHSKIKALLCSQGHYLNLKYQCEEDKQIKEARNLKRDKKCSYCQKVKPPSEFYICNGRFGEKFLSSQCKECVYLAKKKWLEDNREREQERVRRYYAENKERMEV